MYLSKPYARGKTCNYIPTKLQNYGSQEGNKDNFDIDITSLMPVENFVVAITGARSSFSLSISVLCSLRISKADLSENI